MPDLVKPDVHYITKDKRSIISTRYHSINKSINRNFWGSNSETSHSFYVGSYGRGTAIDTSDIDILVELPLSKFEQLKTNRGNVQSQLLQSVKETLPYVTSDVRGDGQVVKVSFTDGLKIEILPAFAKFGTFGNFNGYDYPDSNMGGHWRVTHPKEEKLAMDKKDLETNNLLRATCKHIREIRDNNYSSYKLSGIIIDSFVFNYIALWRFEIGNPYNPPAGTYENKLIEGIKHLRTSGYILRTPGSNEIISINEDQCDVLEKILNKMVE